MKWFEFRPTAGSEIEAGALEHLMNVLHNVEEEFRFVMLSVRDESRNTTFVKFIVGAADDHAESIKRSVGTALNAEVLDVQEPELKGEYYCELHMAKNDVIPLFPQGEKHETNPIDDMAHALEAHSGIILLTARADKHANTKHYKWLLEKQGKSVSFRKEFTKQAGGIVGETWKSPDVFVRGKNAKGSPTAVATAAAKFDKDKNRLDPIIQVEKRYGSNLFDVDIMVIGPDAAAVKTIASRFPSYGLNKLVPYHVKESYSGEVKPVNHLVRRILPDIWGPLGLLMLIATFYFRVFVPQHFLTGPTWTDWGSILAAGAIVFFGSMLFRKHNPIILSSTELGLLVNLPKDITNISVVKGVTSQQRSGMITAQNFPEEKEDEQQ